MDNQNSLQASRQRILLVEDEESLQLLYKRQIELANFNVDAVTYGKEAITKLEQNTYDLVLLDIMLPDINGIDILKALNEKALIKKSPVVLLTNLSQESIIKEGFNLGAMGYLIKSQYLPNDLIVEINNFLAQIKSNTAQ